MPLQSQKDTFFALAAAEIYMHLSSNIDFQIIIVLVIAPSPSYV